MPKTISLNFSEDRYNLFSDQSIVTLSVTDLNDKDFQFQFRCYQEKSKKIDFAKLKEYLKENTRPLLNNKLELYYPNYKPDSINKNMRTQALFQLFPELQHAEFLYKEVLYKKASNAEDNSEIKGKNLINFFKVASYQKDIIQFGYEIPLTNIKDTIPNCCAYFFEAGKLRRKIYLFPYSQESLNQTKNQLSQPNFELKIPYYEENLKENNPNRDTYLRLQSIIGETLAHLEKQKFLRKNGSDKIEIFKALAKKISENNSLEEIKNVLNEHDKVQILSKHRDPWGFFTLFKGETYSAFSWKELGKILSEQDQSAGASLSRQSS